MKLVCLESGEQFFFFFFFYGGSANRGWEWLLSGGFFVVFGGDRFEDG